MDEFSGILPRRRSDTTRLVEMLVRRAHDCRCGGAPSIGLLRGFDQPSRSRAEQLRELIRQGREHIAVVIEPAALEVGVGSTDVHHCLTYDVTSTNDQVAVLGFRWEPNQPERGVLDLTLDGAATVLDPGTGLEVRPSQGGLVVEAIQDHHGTRAVLATTLGPLEVHDREGSHLLFRDEQFMGMAPGQVRLTLEPTGAVRRSAR